MDNSHVFILESVGPEQILDGVKEHKALTAFFRAAGIPYDCIKVASVKTFYEGIERIKVLIREIKKDIYKPIIIHISCHGKKESLILTNGETITWDDFRKVIKDISNTLDEGYDNSRFPCSLVCMSSCYGISAIEIDNEMEKSPAAIIIGPDKEIDWDQSMIAYLNFYNQYLVFEKKGEEAIKFMNTSINDSCYAVYRTKDFEKAMAVKSS